MPGFLASKKLVDTLQASTLRFAEGGSGLAVGRKYRIKAFQVYNVFR